MLQPLWRRWVVRRPSSPLSTTTTTSSWGGRANVNRISYAIHLLYLIYSWGNICANIFEVYLFSLGSVESAKRRLMALLLGGGSISPSTTLNSPSSSLLPGNIKPSTLILISSILDSQVEPCQVRCLWATDDHGRVGAEAHFARRWMPADVSHIFATLVVNQSCLWHLHGVTMLWIQAGTLDWAGDRTASCASV